MTLTFNKTFKKDKMRLHACWCLVFINLKHSQPNVYSILLIAYNTLTKCVEHPIYDWADLEYMHIPVKVKS